MKKYLLIFNMIVLGFFIEVSQASDSLYTPVRISEKIQIIYGPLELPNSHNRGFRSNVVIVFTSIGVVILDPGGSAFAGERVVETIAKLTNMPIVAVFNSHAHGDHWLGNEGIRRHYPQVMIYAHPKMKAKIEGSVGDFWLKRINKLTDGRAEGKKVVAPNMIVNNGDEIKIGDSVFRIHHLGAAHTDNDLMIEIVGENALHMGDVVRNGLIGQMGGNSSFKNNIKVIDFIVNKKFKHTIPGHGKAGGADMPVKYRIFLETLKNKVKALYSKGLADFEMKKMVMKSISVYKNWVGFEERLGGLISRAYVEVEEEDF